MTISEFGQYNYKDRVQTLYLHGVYVGKRKTGNHITVLYQLHSFYVEILYKLYRREIATISITADVNVLTPYLDQIDIKEIITAYK